MLGGDVERRAIVGDPGAEGIVVTVEGGIAKRYHPPVYVSAISWYSV